MKGKRGNRSKRGQGDARHRLVAGVRPVAELLEVAPDSIRRLLVAESSKSSNLAAVIDAARARGIAIERSDGQSLDRLLDGRARHQGVVAETKPFRYSDIEEILAVAEERGETPLVVAVDGVTDPHNLGAIARSAYLLGAHGIIVPRDRSAEVTATVTKSSAGAVEHIAVAQVTNLARALAELKERGLWTYAVAAADDSQPVEQIDFAGPVCLVMGSEGAGLRELVAKQCDFRVEIPMRGSHVGSFNVSVAAAIVLYEIDRQRRS